MDSIMGQNLKAEEVRTPGGTYLVQTIRLSDHPQVRMMERMLSAFSPKHSDPALFETATFRLPSWTLMNPAFSCNRYDDIDEALEGHEEMVHRVAAGKIDGTCN